MMVGFLQRQALLDWTLNKTLSRGDVLSPLYEGNF